MYIISNRRINYLQTILTRNDQKLIKRVYKTQKENPSLGDFVELVKNYFEMIEMNLDEDSISEMSRDAFKKHSKS